MKFKQYLDNISKTQLDITPKEKQLFDDMIIQCQPFIKANKYPLYRGINTDTYRNSIFIKTSRKNREPRDMPTELHDWFNMAFKKKFGVPLRSEGVFASSFWDVSIFGNRFIMIPIGNYTLYYNPTIDDLWSYLGEPTYDSYEEDEYTKEELQEIVNGYKKSKKVEDNNFIEYIITCKKYYVISLYAAQNIYEQITNRVTTYEKAGEKFLNLLKDISK